jgi:hypothetical protein
MNQFFYESRGKEKMKDLQEEGMRSQAFHRSGAPKVKCVEIREVLGKLNT